MAEIRIFGRHLLIVGREAADKNSSVTASHTLQTATGALQHFVAHLEHLSLLGIEPHGLDGSHAKEGWIEVLGIIVQEVTAHDVEAAGAFQIRMEMSIYVKTRGRDFGSLPRSLVDQHLPER